MIQFNLMRDELLSSLQSDPMLRSHCNDAAVIVQAQSAKGGERAAIFQLHKDWTGVRDSCDLQNLTRNSIDGRQYSNFIVDFHWHDNLAFFP
jgi:hypothetical protein